MAKLTTCRANPVRYSKSKVTMDAPLDYIGMYQDYMELVFSTWDENDEKTHTHYLQLSIDEAAEVIRRVMAGAKQAHCIALFDRMREIQATAKVA